MAAAFAERERDTRPGRVEIEVVSGGTNPAQAVHDEVIEAMAEKGIDVSNRKPRKITPDEIEACDYVITMGCDASAVCPALWAGETRDWALDDPHGATDAQIRVIRDEIEKRVTQLFDELA